MNIVKKLGVSKEEIEKRIDFYFTPIKFMVYTEISAFMLIKDNKILIEKRKITKKLYPSKMVIPAGHVENNESPEESMLRELKEELNLTAKNHYYLCSLLHKSNGGLLRIHYFVVDSWEGNFENNEAEELIWTSIDNLSNLSFEVDRVAIKEYLRLL